MRWRRIKFFRIPRRWVSTELAIHCARNTVWRHKGGVQLDSQQHHDRISRAYAAGREQWRGCTWYTPIGPAGADVRELTARQARLLAEATCGSESDAWEAAGKWLAKVELDALMAEKLAAAAAQQVQLYNYAAALEHANHAVALEAQYRQPQVWCALRHLVAELAVNSMSH